MNSKQLTILAGVLLVLAGLVYFKQSTGDAPTIEEEVNLTPLIAEGVSKADIAKLELHNGGAPDEKVVLARDADDPDVWRIASHFDAPAKTETIESYVEDVVGLKGEVRAREQGDEDLATYNLTDETAFHVAGYKAGADAPAFTVLVGKSPDSSQVFMRPEDGRDVYVLDVNLRQEAGIYADDDPAKVPEPGHWLDKAVTAIASDTVDSIAMETPDKRVVFEKVEKVIPVEPPEEGEDPKEPTVEYQWELKEGGPGGEFKQAGLDNWLRAFNAFNATDVVDPATPAEWGLDSPGFKITLGIKDQEDDVVIEAGHPEADGPGYARLSGKDNVIYSISKYNFERAFPKGTDLFDLPALTVAQENVNRIELRQPEGNVVLEKTGEEWSVTEPVLDLNVQTSAVNGIASALASWRASDYADAGVDAGLAAPERTATFTTTDGESHTVALGNDSRGIDGAYAKLDDSSDVLVMSESDINRVFKQAKDFYELTVLDIFDDEIQSIRVDRPEDGFVIARDGEGWTVDYGAGPKPALTSACEQIALAVADFQASNILMGVDDLAGIPTATVVTTLKDGTEHRFTFRAVPDDDSRFEFAYSGKPLVFEANADDVNQLLPSSDSLRAPEPEQAEEKMTDDAANEAQATESTASEPPAQAEAADETMPEESAEAAAEAPAQSDTPEASTTEETAESADEDAGETTADAGSESPPSP